MPDRSALTPEDIRLLMGNYQNIIQMSTILLEQQKQLLDLQKQIVNKHDNIVDVQHQTCDQLKQIANKLDTCATNLQQTHNSIQDSYLKLGDNITTQMKSVENKEDEWRIDVVKQHSGINRNIYVAWGGMISVIIGLITLLLQMYEKYGVLEDIHNLLETLVRYFNG